MASYSIKLDVLRALVAERHTRILALIRAEEAKPMPDAKTLAGLEQKLAALPTWGSYPDEQGIDAEMARWRAIIDNQRRGYT